MKSKTVLMSLFLTGLFFSCKKSGKADSLHEKSVLQADTASPAQQTAKIVLSDSIDLSKLPFSEKVRF